MNRTYLIIIFIAGLAIIGGLIAMLAGTLRTDSNDNADITANANSDITNSTITGNTNISTDFGPGIEQTQVSTDLPTEAELNDRATVQRQALGFATTYGTYSNQNDNEHLKALLDDVTDPLRQNINKYIAENTANAAVGSYHGYTTIAINADIRNITGETASVSVATKRTESGDDMAKDRSFDQSITLLYKKVSDQWLVAEADWQAE
ncbi:MAG: hypothetical protein V1838_00335 [Patescibacteria group bacterium]